MARLILLLLVLLPNESKCEETGTLCGLLSTVEEAELKMPRIGLSKLEPESALLRWSGDTDLLRPEQYTNRLSPVTQG